MLRSNKNCIGIFGGSFDPAHKGHVKISEESIKRLKLKILYWVITNKNPFKKKSLLDLKQRIKISKRLVKNNKIKVKYFENIIKSSRTIDVIRYLKLKNKESKIYLILGSGNLLCFHRWKKWKEIVKLSQIVVFSRKGFDLKAKKSVIVKFLNKKNIIYIKNARTNISSTEIKKNYNYLNKWKLLK